MGARAKVPQPQLARLCEARVDVPERLARARRRCAVAARASRLTAARFAEGNRREAARVWKHDPSVGARATMRQTLKLIFYSALILFVGLPAAFVLFVAGMSIFGVVVGVGF